MRRSRNYAKYWVGLALVALISWAVLRGSFWNRPAPSAFVDQSNSSTLTGQPAPAPGLPISTLLKPGQPTGTRVSEAYGKLPLGFEANQGQADSQVKFLSRGSGYSFFLTPTEAVLQLRNTDFGARDEEFNGDSLKNANSQPTIHNPQSTVVRMKLVGANSQPQITGLEKLPGKSNYFIGNDPAKWRTNVPTYAKVKYQAVYPGVDLVYYGNQRQLEYDLVIAPHADPNVIKLGFEGIEKLRLEAQGDLVLHTSDGEIRLRKPLIYQEVDGSRREVPGSYVEIGQHQVGFQVSGYDVSKPLVIDPILAYSTYLGGRSLDEGDSIAVDTAGNAYVTGRTFSTDFPTTAPYQATYGGSSDAFVVKLNATGSALVYSTFLGGSSIEQGFGIAADAAGNAYVTGRTRSTNFPTANPAQATNRGNAAFKSANGGSSWNPINIGMTVSIVNALIIDPRTPTTLYAGTDVGVFKSTNSGNNWNASNTGLPVASVSALAIDPVTPTTLYAAANGSVFKSIDGGNHWSESRVGLGNAFVNALTIELTTPTTLYASTFSGVFKSIDGGGNWSASSAGLTNTFVNTLAINPVTPTMLYAGTSGGVFKSIDGGGNWSASSAGPTNTFVNTLAIDSATPTTIYAGTNVGVFKSIDGGNNWSASNTGLPNPSIRILAIDRTNPSTLYAGTSRGVYKSTNSGSNWSASNTGLTNTSFGNFNALVIDPANAATLYAGNPVGHDVFVTKLNPTGSALIYSTYLGGPEFDQGEAITVDAFGNAYVTGQAQSLNFPTLNPFQPINSNPGRATGFVTKLSSTGSLAYSTYLGGTGDQAGTGIAVDSAGNAYITGEVCSDNFPTANPLQSSHRGGCDAFITKLSSTGSALVYSTYLGGSGFEAGRAIAVDVAGNAYVTGETRSTNFPTKVPQQARNGGGSDAFVVKLNAAGSALIYSTYLGGGSFDQGSGIAVDTNGNAYLTGETESTDFPITNPVQDGMGGGVDAFVAKLNATGSFVYSTYLGGRGTDQGFGITVDFAGDAYVTGATGSNDFPTANPFQPAIGGSTDVFIAKIDDRTPLPPPVFSVSRIAPNKGGDTGLVSVVIYGRAFAQGATVKLVKAGQPDIVGNPVRIAESGLNITTTFDLTRKARGIWDVVVTNPNGTAATLLQGFTIEQARAPQLWVDILGRDRVRAGREATFQIVYGNSGNVDYDGLAFIALFVSTSTRTVVGRNNSLVTGRHNNLIDVGPVTVRLGSQVVGQFPTDPASSIKPVALLNLLNPAAVSQGRPYSVTFTPPPSETSTVTIGAELFQVPTIVPPLLPRPPRNATGNAVRILFDAKAKELGFGLPELNDLLKEILNEALTGTIEELLKTFVEATGEHLLLAQQKELLKEAIGGTLDRLIASGFDALKAYKATWTLMTRPENFKLFDSALYANWKELAEKNLVSDELKKKLSEILASVDPNAKIGLQGVGDFRYFSGEESLRYSIFFENLETATAPAQEIVIADQLDMTNLDLSTFSFGPITFGGNQVVPPPGLNGFTTDVDLRPANNLILRINAGLNPGTGILTWRLTSLDPATGRLTEDPLVGFLPPNKKPPEGQGSVLFTVTPKKGLATDTHIRNRATIVFDANPPTDTPEWLNTLDNTKPTSQVLPLAAAQNLATFEVKWAGTDVGSGILDYTIFVSENVGPFTVWLSNTTATSETFVGQPGKTYSFYSVARDRTGNLENAKTVADATTQVSANTRTVVSLSAASYIGTGLASESIATAFGTALATATQAATTIPLPTSLAGTTVKVKDQAGTERLAPLFFVSPGQINYQIPPGVVTGTAIVTVTAGNGAVSTGAVQIAAIAPGLFTANSSGQGVPAAIALRYRNSQELPSEPVFQFDGTQFVPRPLDLGPESDVVFLVLFGTGIRHRSDLSAVSARIGGVDAPVGYAGLAPGFVGLDQVNVIIPRSLIGRGEVDVVLVVDGKVANTVKVSIR